MIYLRSLLMTAMLGLFLFIPAGRLDLPFYWLLLGLWWLNMATIYHWLARHNPGLFAERIRPPADEHRSSRLLAAILLCAHLLLAGLDLRFGWSELSPLPQMAGLLLVLAGLLLVDWTLLANPFASSAVRLQQERGQRVISEGPYALVRHPMYLGVLLVSLGSGLALGSWIAALPLLVVIAVFARRTLVEDRMLHTGLPGYPEYAAKVRWRVVPGLF